MIAESEGHRNMVNRPINIPGSAGVPPASSSDKVGNTNEEQLSAGRWKRSLRRVLI